VVKIVFAGAAGLGDDEAYDWEWSRHLDWSFFDHPVMTGLLIRISTLLYGHTEWAVRLPAVISSVGGGLFLFLLAQHFFSRATAWWTLFLYVFIPGLSLGSFLAVPDAPMTIAWLGCTWMLGTWIVIRNGRTSLNEDYPPLKFWIIFGLLLGFGFLSKYTTLFVALSSAAWLIAIRPKWLKKPEPWYAVLLAFLCCLPILNWNWSQGWPSFKFHLADRQAGGGGLSFTRWGQYVAAQVVLLSPILVFGLGLAAVAMLSKK
jgi:dolichol-phosphate mannosyltransferase